MLELMIILTVVEVLLVVGVLLGYLVQIRERLGSTAKFLARIAFGVRAIEIQASAIGPSTDRINAALDDMTAAAPRLADEIERLPQR